MSIFKRPLSYVEENCGNMSLCRCSNQRHKFADILRHVQFVLRSRTLLILHVCAWKTRRIWIAGTNILGCLKAWNGVPFCVASTQCLKHFKFSARGPTSALPVLQDPTGTYQPLRRVTYVTCKSALQECQMSQMCQTRSRECPTGVSHKSTLWNSEGVL
jgi:hypothetical protein